jgi:hypothetical protein
MPKQDIVSAWRAKHLEELDKNLDTWASIRDDPEASDKDRIMAAQSISRQMGAMTADAVSKKSGEVAHEKPALKKDHMDELDTFIENL